MVEAIDSTQCQEIAEEVFKNVTEHVTEQNKNTLEKTLTISMDVFSNGENINNYRSSEIFKQLPAGEPRKMKIGHSTVNIPGINMLKIMNEKRVAMVTDWVQKLEGPFDRLEFCVILLVDSNEVFKENKSFDQFRMVSKVAV
ncbi:MAG: hypothetical protein H7A41_00435 [Chlamydiales bacterium]|nr:hypothetical protein [Chlamydiales bacterium]